MGDARSMPRARLPSELSEDPSPSPRTRCDNEARARPPVVVLVVST